MSDLTEREQAFFDSVWSGTEIRPIEGTLRIPGIESLAGKRVLICSCGSGEEPVRAARAGAEVHAFDISPVAVERAVAVARFNGVEVKAAVMDFHGLEYPDDFFDVIYGCAILHHVDCERVGAEIHRCLKPGGIAYFMENSDRNPVLRWVRRRAFGEPGGYQKQRFLFFKRHGTSDEYPLTQAELAVLSRVFAGSMEVMNERFVFFELLSIHGWRNPVFLRWTQRLDRLSVRVFPRLLPYSFLQEVLLRKPGEARASGRPEPAA